MWDMQSVHAFWDGTEVVDVPLLVSSIPAASQILHDLAAIM